MSEVNEATFGTGNCICGFAADGMYGSWVISPKCELHGEFGSERNEYKTEYHWREALTQMDRREAAEKRGL